MTHITTGDFATTLKNQAEFLAALATKISQTPLNHRPELSDEEKTALNNMSVDLVRLVEILSAVDSHKLPF